MKIRAPHNLSLVTRTVYTMYWDEVMAVQDEHWRSRPHGLFAKSYERSQIDMHKPFLARYREWSGMGLRKTAFPNIYATSGATEALDILMRKYQGIHVFKGDYEGFKQLARADHRNITEHVRRVDAPNDKSFRKAVAADDVFIVSYPSAIDGECWGDMETWLSNMRDKLPKAKVILDLSYIGTLKQPANFDIYRHSNVEAVVFSFSKPFGTAFHRIGGVFSRHMSDRLEYNRYFKNVPGIDLGFKLMERHTVDAIPLRYAALQEAALKQAKLAQEVPESAVCSNAIMLARSDNGSKEFERTTSHYRFCLSKGMDLIHHGQILASHS